VNGKTSNTALSTIIDFSVQHVALTPHTTLFQGHIYMEMMENVIERYVTSRASKGSNNLLCAKKNGREKRFLFDKRTFCSSLQCAFNSIYKCAFEGGSSCHGERANHDKSFFLPFFDAGSNENSKCT
jgi:hypothetical protein